MVNESLAEIVRRAAAEHPDEADPRSLVPFVREQIEGREHEILDKLLPSAVAAVLRRREGGGDAWLALLEERMPTPEGYKFVRDGTADDLDAAAERRRRFGGNLDRRARLYGDLAKRVRDGGATVVADLRESQAVDLLVGLEQEIIRTRRERMTVTARSRALASALRLRDDLRGQLESGETPRILHYRAMLEYLATSSAALLEGIARGDRAEELLSDYGKR